MFDSSYRFVINGEDYLIESSHFMEVRHDVLCDPLLLASPRARWHQDLSDIDFPPRHHCSRHVSYLCCIKKIRALSPHPLVRIERTCSLWEICSCQSTTVSSTETRTQSALPRPCTSARQRRATPGINTLFDLSYSNYY